MVPDADESKIFCVGIWDVPVVHSEHAEWLKHMENDTRDVRKQVHVKIKIDVLTHKLKKVANWNGPGTDGVKFAQKLPVFFS